MTDQIRGPSREATAEIIARFANADRIIIVRRDSHGDRRIPFDYGSVVTGGFLEENLALQSGDTVVVP